MTVAQVPVPHDYVDGFLYAFWRRPDAYLVPAVRSVMSSFHALGDVSAELHRLKTDLDGGAWQKRYGRLLDLDDFDMGYRLVTSR
ncbi:MAG: hypothetical protein AAGB11_13740 [Pseudomonadota bacterium]